MTRSVWKGPFVDITLIKTAEKHRKEMRQKTLKQQLCYSAYRKIG